MKAEAFWIDATKPELAGADRERRIQAGRQRFEELRAARRSRAASAAAPAARAGENREARPEMPSDPDPEADSLPKSVPDGGVNDGDPILEEIPPDTVDVDTADVWSTDMSPLPTLPPPTPRAEAQRDESSRDVNAEDSLRDEELRQLEVMVMGLRRTEAAAMSELQVKRQRIAAAEMNVQRLTRQARQRPATSARYPLPYILSLLSPYSNACRWTR